MGLEQAIFCAKSPMKYNIFYFKIRIINMNTMNPLPNLKPIAVVTGAGQGMGRAIALKLAGNGYQVVLIGRTLAKLEQVRDEIEQVTGTPPRVYSLDVTVGAQVDQMRQDLEGAAAQVDVLVNGAGEALIATLEDTSEADWDRVLAINLKGPFLMVRALLPLLRKSPNAMIINVASKVALSSYHSEVAAYTAAKTGLMGFTHALAAELREDGIRVVGLCPGPVDTPMRWAATPDHDPRQVIDVDTIADTMMYLVQLPKGVTMGEILIQSINYDL
jgi:NAD(P)-dependent dehydrogenase (short-subunit alcohol dehydrogenase family)